MRSISFPVTLSDGSQHSLSATFHSSDHAGAGKARGKLLQVAVHGVSYDRRYWDAPSFGGVSYSYAQFMLERGDAVLAIDQLGSGQSSRPDGDFLGLDETARSLASLVEQLRSPHNPLGIGFERVVLVGQSFGGLSALRAQAAGAGADALLLTGWLNHAPPAGDPKDFEPFFAQPTVQLPPPMRQAIFYHPAGTDPALAAYDANELNQPFTRAQFKDLLTASTTDSSVQLASQIKVPVLLQVGREDGLMSGTTISKDARHYSHSRAVTAIELPNAGHNLALHRNAQESFNYTDRWLAQYVRG